MTGIITLGALGASLSVDAFAAAVGKGASGGRHGWSDALRVGAVFGVFEAVTPAIGWAVGLALSTRIEKVDHWIAFFLLLGVGAHMIYAAMQPEEEETADTSRSIWRLMATALATSIDATAVGVSLAVMQVNILTACFIIGAITTVVATVGVKLGRHAGERIGRRAEMLGGAALIAIGGSILFQHLTAAPL